jgi:hypothetical protein
MPTIERSEPYTDLMHLSVVHGDTIYLAGIVADDLGVVVENPTLDPSTGEAETSLGTFGSNCSSTRTPARGSVAT